MDGPIFSVYKAQVMGTDSASGTMTVGLTQGGGSIIVGHCTVAGNSTTGLHWMPFVGDWVLLAYEPGLVAQVLCPLSDMQLAGGMSPPLTAGEVRMAGALAISGMLTAQGQHVVGTDAVVHGGAPGSTTSNVRVTFDGGVTFYRIALAPD